MKKLWTELSLAEIKAVAAEVVGKTAKTLANCRYAASSLLRPDKNKFCVECPNSVMVYDFDYKTARQYAEIFDGKVVHAKTKRVYWEKKPTKIPKEA